MTSLAKPQGGTTSEETSENAVEVVWWELSATVSKVARSHRWCPAPELEVDLLRAMLRVRWIDRALFNASRQGTLGVYTPMAGQEATQVGAVLAMTPRDWLTPTFRDLGAQLCRGEPLARLMQLHMGLSEGAVSHEPRNLPFAAPVASQLPHAVGLAWAEQLDGGAGAVLALLGDGATSKGDFHEALNLAGVLGAPVVFLCQNNGWALSTPLAEQTAAKMLAQKAAGYGMQGLRVDGDDALAVHWVTKLALDRARKGAGPTFIEAVTTRRGPHSVTDDPKTYGAQPPEDLEDPVALLRAALVQRGRWGEGEEAAWAATVRQEIAHARREAETVRERACPTPVFAHVYAEPTVELRAQADAVASGSWSEPALAPREPEVVPVWERGASMNMVEALRVALGEALEHDPQVLLLGEDIGRLGGVFRVTAGLQASFGAERVVDTPLSESGIVGAAIGLAVAGKRPVCEVQFAGFVYAAYDQLRNHAARFRSRTHGQHTVPMVLRAPYGGSVRAPESHSDSVEMIFVRSPGIKVVVPSSPARAKALLAAALRDPDPVVFLEPIALYRGAREVVPEEPITLPLGRCFVLRPGDDITLVTYGATTHACLAAAEVLQGEGVGVEVIDLATLSPLDAAGVAGSVAKTRRLLVVHEGYRAGDIGAELLARLHAALGPTFEFDRVCGWDVPQPLFARERALLPNAQRIVTSLRKLATAK